MSRKEIDFYIKRTWKFEGPTFGDIWFGELRDENRNEGVMRDDRNFDGGMRDKNISAGAGFTHFDRLDAG